MTLAIVALALSLATLALAFGRERSFGSYVAIGLSGFAMGTSAAHIVILLLSGG